MPMLIVLVGDPATLNTAKSLDSRHKHSGMTMFFNYSCFVQRSHFIIVFKLRDFSFPIKKNK